MQAPGDASGNGAGVLLLDGSCRACRLGLCGAAAPFDCMNLPWPRRNDSGCASWETRSLRSAQVCQEIAETFLAEPTHWRDVVETAVYLAAVRECEQALGQRIRGPGRTTKQLQIKLDSGLIALMLGGALAIADGISAQFRTRLGRLRSANVVLLYEGHQYLQLTGVQAGRSIRRHLPRGLHLIFSEQQHRRADRTAGLWLDQSEEEKQAGSYHFAEEVPLFCCKSSISISISGGVLDPCLAAWVSKIFSRRSYIAKSVAACAASGSGCGRDRSVRRQTEPSLGDADVQRVLEHDIHTIRAILGRWQHLLARGETEQGLASHALTQLLLEAQQLTEALQSHVSVHTDICDF